MRELNMSVCQTVVEFVAMVVVGLLWCLQSFVQAQPLRTDSPHIVLILADDLGWNDVSFHGSNQFQTPNIDALAYSGIILQDYYTQPICTPARAALLTGRHPISNGMEHDVIYAPQPWGLPLSERILPQYLKELGYVTRAVGKWHLGFFHSNYTAAKRGFDSHYGIWLGHQDHYTHMGYEPNPGYDFHRGLNASWDAKGHYSTELFTEEAKTLIQEHNASRPLFLYLAHTAPHGPLQAPAHLVTKFSYIPNKKRQIFAAMVTALDEGVGRVVAALKEKDMLDNSIILVLTDNGGATHGYDGNVASNWPLRGCKDTLWEGGVRGVGLIWSPLLEATPRVHQGLVNVQDWLPTLLEAAGASIDASKIDGVSQWSSLQQRKGSPYSTMLHNIDPLRNIAALRYGDWKLITGRTHNGQFDGFYGRLSGQVPYDLDKIRESDAGQAVRDSLAPLPRDEEMLRLRQDATVLCNNSKTKTPHVIQVRHVNVTDDRKNDSDTGSAQIIQKNSETTTDAYKHDPECHPHVSPCLFNLREDPCETRNLASLLPDTLKHLMTIIQSFQPAHPNNKPEDPRSFPGLWNNTWTTWMDFV